MRKRGSTTSGSGTFVTLAAISPPGVDRAALLGATSQV